MKTAVLCLTGGGYRVARTVREALQEKGHRVTLFTPDRAFARDGETVTFHSLAGVVAEVFGSYRHIVFVMALGIVVRMITPHIRDKNTDPAVVVLDEAGEHVISVLSGHLGGANELARQIAGLTGARPVITTATDVHGLPALDELARVHNLVMDPPGTARQVNTALVNGGTVAFFVPERMLPAFAHPNAPFYPLAEYGRVTVQADYTVVVSNRLPEQQAAETVFLRPRNLVAGVGCRAGTPVEQITTALYRALEQCRRSPRSLRALATIEIKAREPGLLAAARRLNLPLLTFAPDKINAYLREEGQALSHSAFVHNMVGVPAVCEPAALLASRKGELILPKQKFPGVTVALAEDGWQ